MTIARWSLLAVAAAALAPAGVDIAASASTGGAKAATDLAFAPRGQIDLPMVVAEDIPEIGVQAGVPLPRAPGSVSKGARGCACSSDFGGEGAAGAIALSAFVGLLIVRRSRRKI